MLKGLSMVGILPCTLPDSFSLWYLLLDSFVPVGASGRRGSSYALETSQ